jgi:hypothetical protein
VADQPWDRATALTGREDSPRGVVSDGVNVFFTTGLTQAGEHAVRVAPLRPGPAGPASRILAADPAGQVPNGPLFLDGDDLYVAAGSGIVKVSKTTGAATPVVDGRPTGVTSVVVDGDYVWWTTSTYKFPTAAEVARRPKRGGPVEILAAGVDDKGKVYEDDRARAAVAVAGTGSFGPLLLAGADVLVASPGAILRARPGRPPEVVSDSAALGGAPTRIAADADRIYAEIAGGRDNLVAIPRAGGRPVELVGDVDNTNDIALSAGEVVFITSGGVGRGGKAAVNAVPVAGGPARILASGRYAAGDLAVVGDRAVFSADDRVWSAPLHAP